MKAFILKRIRMNLIKKIPLYFIIALVAACTTSEAKKQNAITVNENYVCMPCGQDCDTINYTAAGKCSHCNMSLVKASTITFKRIQPSEICAYIAAHPDVVLLDVRTKEEFEGNAEPDFGTLKNAMNIPVQELEKRLPEISSLKEKELIVFCSHSHRSPRASYMLGQNGFTNVCNMEGGMSVLTDSTCKK